MADLKAGITTSFNGGEIAPYLAGRIDHEGFSKCIRKLVNGIPEVGGGIKKFYGTEFVHALPLAKNFALIPFHHEDDVFLLVLHDGVMDAIVDDRFVELGILLPTISDYQSIRYEQANDVLICCSAECAPFRIEYYGVDREVEESFGLRVIDFDEVPYFSLGYTGNYSGPLEIEGVSGTVKARIPVTLRENTLKVSYPVTLPKGTFSVSGKIYRGFLTKNDKVYVVEPTIGDIKVSLLKTVSGQGTSVVKETIVNSLSAGTAYIPSYDDRATVKKSSSSAPDLTHYLYWTSNNFSYNTFKDALIGLFGGGYDSQPDVYIPVNLINGFDSSAFYEVVVSIGRSVSNNNASNDIALGGSDSAVHKNTIAKLGLVMSGDASKHYGSVGVVPASVLFSDINNLVGRKLKIYQNASDSPISAWHQEMSVTANKTVVWSDGKYYLAKNGTTTKSVQPTHTEGIVSDGGVDWLYLHSGYVTATIVGVQDEYEMSLFLKDGNSVPVPNLDLNTNTFSTYRWSIWGANAIYPSEIFFNNGRLGYFVNTKYGTYYSMSRSDSYYDFSEDTHGEVLDTDSIQGLVTGGSFSNKINWVISRENIYCGSYGTEFVISGLDGLMTPSTTVCKPVSFTGGDKIAALKYMTLSMFVGAGGDNLNVVNYDYSSETYIPLDISYIAGHLLKDKVKKVVGAPRPDNCIYMVTRSGGLVQLVDSEAEKITAFSDMRVGDNVLDVSAVFCENETQVYLARVVGEEIHIEKFSVDEPTYMLSSRRFAKAPAKVVVPSFAKEEVYVKRVSDGQFCKVVAANDGAIVNSFVGEDIIVGKPMKFIVHGIPSVGKKLEGMQQKSVRFLVRLLGSGAFSYGSSHDFDKWYDYNNWSATEDQEWDSSHKLMTGDIQLPASFGYMQGQNTADGPYPNDTSVALNIFSDTPEPFNLLMVSNIYV